METRLREQLSDTKRRLNDARREQAKAGEMYGEEGCTERSNVGLT